MTLKSFFTGPLSKTITFPLEMKKRRERSVRRLFLAVRTVTACPQTIKTHRLNMFFALFPFLEVRMGRCTDKKENQIFLIYTERKFRMEQLQSHI
jgi:hypothetical protein